jgi:hypothetical protein
MSRVGFEPTIPAFEREKTVHALDRATTGSASTHLLTINLYEGGNRWQRVSTIRQHRLVHKVVSEKDLLYFSLHEHLCILYTCKYMSGSMQ